MSHLTESQVVDLICGAEIEGVNDAVTLPDASTVHLRLNVNSPGCPLP